MYKRGLIKRFFSKKEVAVKALNKSEFIAKKAPWFTARSANPLANEMMDNAVTLTLSGVKEADLQHGMFLMAMVSRDFKLAEVILEVVGCDLKHITEKVNKEALVKAVGLAPLIYWDSQVQNILEVSQMASKDMYGAENFEKFFDKLKIPANTLAFQEYFQNIDSLTNRNQTLWIEEKSSRILKGVLNDISLVGLDKEMEKELAVYLNDFSRTSSRQLNIDTDGQDISRGDIGPEESLISKVNLTKYCDQGIRFAKVGRKQLMVFMKKILKLNNTIQKERLKKLRLELKEIALMIEKLRQKNKIASMLQVMVLRIKLFLKSKRAQRIILEDLDFVQAFQMLRFILTKLQRTAFDLRNIPQASPALELNI
jgi:hypothetical protein